MITEDGTIDTPSSVLLLLLLLGMRLGLNGLMSLLHFRSLIDSPLISWDLAAQSAVVSTVSRFATTVTLALHLCKGETFHNRILLLLGFEASCHLLLLLPMIIVGLDHTCVH